MKKGLLIGCFGIIILWFGWKSPIIISQENAIPLDEQMPVSQALEKLGVENPNKLKTIIDGASAERGEELVLKGYTKKPKGGRTRNVSRYFKCTSCHNIKREDPDLANINPQKRLDYVVANDMPYLQGTTFHGIVNRESFYNDDYFKKYGQLVFPARESLKESIQLCAMECAQGRRLKDWELQSIILYFWELELKLEDLNLSEAEKIQVLDALSSSDGQSKEKAAQLLRTKYPLKSPATFIDPEPTREKRKNVSGDIENGQKLYEASCQHCHFDNLYSFFILDDERMTFKYLKRNLAKYDTRSVHQLVRYGTPPKSGKRSYMPHYPLEKMTQEQLNDLIAYIEHRAK